MKFESDANKNYKINYYFLKQFYNLPGAVDKFEYFIWHEFNSHLRKLRDISWQCDNESLFYLMRMNKDVDKTSQIIKISLH